MNPSGNRDSAESQVPAEWNVGDVILGLYEVKGIHEGGGMGLVYRVFHRGWNMDLAVKSPRPEFFHTERQKEDFIRECETWINLGLHPHIVSCHYVRTLWGIPRVFAEYVESGSLRDWIDSRKLYEGGPQEALKRILDIAIQLAWGLHYAHEKGVIHQDVKPANVLMLPDGTAKLTDFGLAKARRATGESTSTDRQRSILVSSGGMTPAYCSPEQANNQPLSRKTDIWSWAVSVLEVFAGEVSWQSGVAAPEILKHMSEVRTEGLALPEMPESLQELLQRCLEFDPAKRPKDAAEISRRLAEIYRSQLDEEHTRPEALAVELQAGALNNKALSLLDLGRPEETEELLEEALRLEPQHVAATYNRGLILWRSARIADDTVVAQMEEARQSHRDDWRADYLLALVHLERQEGSQAAQALRGIVEVAGNQPEVATASARARHLERVVIVLQGHSKAVVSGCISADGRYVLSGSFDKTLRLWEVATGRCLRTIAEHTGTVYSVCISEDGLLALSGADDGTLRLWEVATGRLLRTFDGHAQRVSSVCLSEDVSYALSGSWDKTVRLWEVATGHCLRTFVGHTDTVESVCLSADGRYALSGGGKPPLPPSSLPGAWDEEWGDCTVRLWDVASGDCLRTFSGHTHNVSFVCFSEDMRYALSGGGTLKLWELADGRCLRTTQGDAGTVNGRYSLSGGDDGTLRLWEVVTGRLLRTFAGHAQRVNSVCWSRDGRYALSASADKTLKLWELGGADWAAPFEPARIAGTEEVARVANRFKRLLNEAAAAMESGKVVKAAVCLRQARALPGCQRRPEVVRQWDRLYTLLPRYAFAGGWEARTLASGVLSVCMSRDGGLALSGGYDGKLHLWELATGHCLRTFEGHIGPVTSVCLSRDGRFALSHSSVKHVATAALWEVATGRGRRVFGGNFNLANTLRISGDGRYALSGGDSNGMRLWDVATGRCLRTFVGPRGEVNTVCWSGDDRYALSGESDGTIRLWDVATGRCLRKVKSGEVWKVCWSDDGQYALSGHVDHALRFWDVATGRCLRTLEGHSGLVASVCLSGDGRFALSGSSDKTIRLWEVATGRCLRIFGGHTDSVHSVCLSGDGRYALSGSHDGTIRSWHLDWKLEDREAADWDEGAKPYLDAFLSAQVPHGASLPLEGTPSEPQVTEALTRRGKPVWELEDVERLFHNLSYAGYGWLRPDGVRRKLEELASQIQPTLPLKSVWTRLFSH
jgi:WD40 repeat protein/serine/threonine protein kinase